MSVGGWMAGYWLGRAVGGHRGWWAVDYRPNGRYSRRVVRGPVDPVSNGGEDAHARAAISRRGEFGLGFVKEVGLGVVGAGITLAGVPLAETGVTVRPMGGR